MNKRYQRITQKQFIDALEASPRMGERARMVAKQVLVDGVSQRAVLEQLEKTDKPCTKQMISYWVMKVYTNVVPAKPGPVRRVRDASESAGAAA